jgi:hypothetical protein
MIWEKCEKLTLYILTYFIEKNPWEADSRPVGPESTHITWKSKSVSDMAHVWSISLDFFKFADVSDEFTASIFRV